MILLVIVLVVLVYLVLELCQISWWPDDYDNRGENDDDE
jgi:hypothetical protein